MALQLAGMLLVAVAAGAATRAARAWLGSARTVPGLVGDRS
jgi:hypothetical protein